MTPKAYDFAIIGAGSAGLTFTAVAAQLGYNVVLFEKHKMGGDCLNTGCVPSKALLHAAKKKQDFKSALAYVHSKIAAIAPHDSVERFTELGATVVEEFAHFRDKNVIETISGKLFTAKRIIISTGSTASLPPIPGLSDTPHLTNETIFDLKEQPKHLIVVGGGAIGLEMAEAFTNLGSKVTLFEAGPRIMPRDDADAAAVVHQHLTDLGITIHTNAKITKTSGTTGAIEIQSDTGTLKASHLLMAAGRKPNSANLNLDAAGIEMDGRGFILANQQCRTTQKHVFAVGDVTGGAQFTHTAGNESAIVIQRLLFGQIFANKNKSVIPWVTYTTPEVAQMGMTAADAEAAFGSDNIRVLRVDGKNVDRMITENEEKSFLKVILHKGKVVGATGVGPHAGEWLAPWGLIMANGLKLGALNKIMAPYPTRWEINKKAVSQYYTELLYSKKTSRISKILFKLLG